MSPAAFAPFNSAQVQPSLNARLRGSAPFGAGRGARHLVLSADLIQPLARQGAVSVGQSLKSSKTGAMLRNSGPQPASYDRVSYRLPDLLHVAAAPSAAVVREEQ